MPLPFLLGYLFQALIGIAIAAGFSLLQRALFPPEQPREPGIRGSLQIGGANPLAFPIGRVAVAGQLEYAGTWGQSGDTPNAFFSRIISLSDLPINSLQGLYVNGARVTIDKSNPETDRGFPVTEFRLNGVDHMWIKFYDGTQTAADPLMVSQFSTDPERPWTSGAIGTGVAYVVATAKINRELFTGFPEYLFEVEGISLYDITKDTTAGGSGTQRANDPTTWAYSENPFAAIHTVFQGIKFGTQWLYGLQAPLPLSRTPYAIWEAAINECDRTITLADSSTEPNFRCGFEVTCDFEPINLIEELLKSSAGRLADIGGQYKVLSNAPAAAVKSFTDEDLIISAPRDYRPFPPLQNINNGITAIYPEPDEAYQNKDAPARFSATFEAQDDDRRLVASVDYSAVPFRYQVQRLMQVALNEERRFRVHAVEFPANFWQVEPLDVLTWTSTENGYVNKEFLIISMDVRENGNVLAVIKEIDNADYPWTAADQLPAPIGNIEIIRPPAQPLTGWTVAPETIEDAGGNERRPGIRVSYAGLLADVRAVRVQARLAINSNVVFDGEHPYDPLAATPANVLVGNFLPAEDYEVRGMFLPYSGRATEWSAWLAVTTPDLRFGPDDIAEGAIDIPRLQEDVRNMQSWMATNIRDIEQEFENLIAGTADQDAGNFVQIQRAERNLSVRLGNAEAVFSEQISVLATQTDALATQLTSLTATVGNVSANGSFRTQVEASPGAGTARIGLQASADNGVSFNSAAFFLEADTSGVSRAVVQADAFAVIGSGGAFLGGFFSVDDEINLAYIPTLQADKINVTQLSAISANAGTITSGLIRSADDNMRLELDNTRLIVSDNT